MSDVLVGDCREMLAFIPDDLVQCCVTSPPYFGLRSYLPDGHPDKGLEVGAETTPEAYIAEMVAVFRDVRRVLRHDGTLWLNLGDRYGDGKWGGSSGGKHVAALHGNSGIGRCRKHTGLKPKDLLMIPARVAIALQADGWYLRSDIIWHKPNPMPESVTDRPTSAHEHVFLLTKSSSYFYDAAAVCEMSKPSSIARLSQNISKQIGSSRANGGTKTNGNMKAVGGETRNLRNVWSINTHPFRGAHFATMPVELAEKCIKAGSRPGDFVLDPFFGAGTTGVAAKQLGRRAIGIELNPAYAEMAKRRVENTPCPHITTNTTLSPLNGCEI